MLAQLFIYFHIFSGILLKGNWVHSENNFIKITAMKTNSTRSQKQNEPVKPEKDIPSKPDPNPDPTKPKPGGNEPKKNDPTRIEEPQKTDPTRIDEPKPPKQQKPGQRN